MTQADGKLTENELRKTFSTHAPKVYRRALSILGDPEEAKDVTQEVFIKAIQESSGFRAQSQLSTWLYRITTNICLNILRDSRRRERLRRERIGPQEEVSAPAPPEDRLLIRQLLAQTDERWAAAAVCVYVDGMSYREAAEVLGVSKRTIGNFLTKFQEFAEQYLKQAKPGANHE